MTQEQPQVKPASRYSTRETCLLLGMSRSTLIRKTNLGLITPMRYKGSTHNYYTGLEITRYWNSVANAVRMRWDA